MQTPVRVHLVQKSRFALYEGLVKEYCVFQARLEPVTSKCYTAFQLYINVCVQIFHWSVKYMLYINPCLTDGFEIMGTEMKVKVTC